MAYESISNGTRNSCNALSLSLSQLFVGTASHSLEELTKGQCLLLRPCDQLEVLFAPSTKLDQTPSISRGLRS